MTRLISYSRVSIAATRSASSLVLQDTPLLFFRRRLQITAAKSEAFYGSGLAAIQISAAKTWINGGWYNSLLSLNN